MAFAGGEDCADACNAELAEHAEHPCDSIDNRAGGFIRHELSMPGMEECSESIAEGGVGESPAHEVHIDSRRSHCLRVDDTHTHEGHEQPAAAMPTNQCATEHLHDARTYHQGRVEVGSIQRATRADDTRWGERLLGCSGRVTAAAQRALQEVEELHQSDALMHYEVCWPHPELTDVRLTVIEFCCAMRMHEMAPEWDDEEFSMRKLSSMVILCHSRECGCFSVVTCSVCIVKPSHLEDSHMHACAGAAVVGAGIIHGAGHPCV